MEKEGSEEMRKKRERLENEMKREKENASRLWSRMYSVTSNTVLYERTGAGEGQKKVWRKKTEL